MLKTIKSLFTENVGLKIIALVIGLMIWFYIVDELNKGSSEEKRFLNMIRAGKTEQAGPMQEQGTR